MDISINQSQIAAISRHVVTYAMGAATAAAAFGLLNSNDVGTISTSLGEISDGVAKIAAGLAPLVAMASGVYAAWAASRKAQIASVNAIPGVKVVNELATSAPAVSTPPTIIISK